jgi:hypothetical protein
MRTEMALIISRNFDFFTERLLDAAGVGSPAIAADEGGPHALRTGTDLGEQMIRQRSSSP